MEPHSPDPAAVVAEALRAVDAIRREAHSLSADRPPGAPQVAPQIAPQIARKPVAIIRPMTEVTASEVDWLWPGWLARGKFHLLGGFAGDGKSTLTAALAAAASRGAPWPDAQPGVAEQRTLFVLGEDAAGDTLKPRLALHNADMRHVLILDAIQNERGQLQTFDVSRHLEVLEEALTAQTIDLLVIDPLTTVMPGADRNAEGAIRDLLTPLVKLAEQRGVAVVGVVHIGKSGEARRAAQKILGATAFVAMARLVLMVAPDGDDTMALGVVKSNLARKPRALTWERDEAGAIRWLGETESSLETLLTAPPVPPQPAPRAAAEAFLRAFLTPGARPAREVEDAATAEGIAYSTLRRASAAVGIRKVKSGASRNAPWCWELPAAREDAQGAHAMGPGGDGHLEHLVEPDPSPPAFRPRTLPNGRLELIL